jgi:intracellular multiplication protein IcmP
MADKQDGMTEKFMGWAMILVVVGIVLYICYRLWTPEIHSGIRWIRYAEMQFISYITPDSYTVKLATGDVVNLKEWVDRVGRIPKEKIDWTLLGGITAVALTPFKWFFMGVIALIGFWTYTRGPGTQYIEVFNLDSFIRFQSKAFPIISPFVRFNPSNQPPRPPGSPVPAELPLFAEALGPEEWLAYNQIPVPDGKLDEKSVFKAFARQLGPRWKGAKHLDPYKQVFLAACCLKAARKRKDADKMLGRLASCWRHDTGLQLSRDKTLVKEARRILKNKDIAYKVLKNCSQHAWETTALLRALLTAREEGGVLAPAQFVWLRAHNRDLWYPLNNLGRKSHHMEAIGAMAHFRAEKRAERPVPKPKVHDAVESITEYMDSSNARPIPTLDYSYSKNKRGVKKLKTA